MHDTEAKPDVAVKFRFGAGRVDHGHDSDDLRDRIDEISLDGNIEVLIAFACEKALASDPPPEAARHAGARAAIQAYAAWKQAEGRDVPIRVLAPETGPEPEILPLSLAGKWVAWSSDGLRIVASAETSDEAVRLAAEAGEPEPILEPHPGRCRLL